MMRGSVESGVFTREVYRRSRSIYEEHWIYMLSSHSTKRLLLIQATRLLMQNLALAQFKTELCVTVSFHKILCGTYCVEIT